jgi:hypothetical protein
MREIGVRAVALTLAALGAGHAVAQAGFPNRPVRMSPPALAAAAISWRACSRSDSPMRSASR